MKHTRQVKNAEKRLLSLIMTLAIVTGIITGGMLGTINAAAITDAAMDETTEMFAIPDAPTRYRASAVNIVAVETNYLGGLALDDTGKVWTWGYNVYGKLGTGAAIGTYAGGMEEIHYFVENNIKIVQIIGGYNTSFAVDDKGNVYAWGRGLEGQMGNNTTTVNNAAPVIVSSLQGKKITKVAVTSEAASAAYAIDTDGNVYAWGYADGYRINGAIGYQKTAKHLPEFDGLDIVDIELGAQHGIALDSAGQIYTWGYNAYGQLGHGDTMLRQIPKKVEFFSDKTVKDISAESSTSIAVTIDGKAYKWGMTYEATGSLKTSYDSPGGTIYYSPAGVSRSVKSPELIEFDLSSAPEYNSLTPEVAFATAGRYVSYITDVYGRVWYFGWNVNYGFATDGPLFTTTNGGKHSVYATKATLLRTLGDGDTQGGIRHAKAPVFSGAATTDEFLPQYNSYNMFGQWSSLGDGLHPTIYDKKYMVTSDPGSSTLAKDYPLDSLGRRLVYVINRESTAPIRYHGNFYVAEDSYTGAWCVNNSSTTALPAGVTTQTSVPAVNLSERAWIGLTVDIDNFDYTGSQLNEMPFITGISTYQSQTLFIDKSGNMYQQSLDGSGAITWGWDYSKYEKLTAGNSEARGLYNFYNYEIMYARGTTNEPPYEVCYPEGLEEEEEGPPLAAAPAGFAEFGAFAPMSRGGAPMGPYGLMKTAEPNTFTDNGETIIYTISFTLPEDISAYEAVKITDIMPESGLMYWNNATLKIGNGVATSVTTIADTSGNGNQSYILAGQAFEDAAGETVELALTFRTFDWKEGDITNTAALYIKPVGGEFEADPSSIAFETIGTVRQSALVAGKSVIDANEDMYASAGEMLTYTITITNNGNGEAEDVSISDTLSEILDYIDDPGDNTLTITGVDVAVIGVKTVADLIDGFIIPEIGAGGAVIVTFNVTVRDDIDTSIVRQLVNTATIIGTETLTASAEIKTKKPLNVAKNVEGVPFDKWAGDYDGDINELIGGMTFKLYKVDEDSEIIWDEVVATGTVSSLDGRVRFDPPTIYDEGWYAVVEEFTGKTARKVFDPVGPMIIYVTKDGVMSSSLSKHNVDGKFEIKYSEGYTWDVKLVYEDGKVFDGGTKPDGSGQRLATEKFEVILPDGTIATSFCADLGAHNVFGTYEFDIDNHGFDNDDMLYLIAALDYIHHERNISDDPIGKALAQIIVWNVILKVDGSAGFADTWYPDSQLALIEGASGWYDSYKDFAEFILNNRSEIIDIYNDRLMAGSYAEFVSGVIFITGDGVGELPINQQRQMLVLFNEDMGFTNILSPVPPKVEDLEKVADPKTFKGNGDEIEYTISFTMPENLDGFEALKIVDVIPDELSYISNSAKLSIGGGAAVPVTMITDANGNIYYIIEGDDFTDAAGKFIELTLMFAIDGWVSGNIENTAELYFKPINKDFPDDPDEEDDEVIYPPLEVIDLVKAADPRTFKGNGDLIDYTISFTMPDVLDGYAALKIVDVIPDELSYIANSAKLSIGGGAAKSITMTEDADGNLYYIMNGDEFTDSAGKFIKLTLVFEVDGWVSGDIENTAELYFKPIDKEDFPDDPDAEDDETIYPPTKVIDLLKAADPRTFRGNGDLIDYTISFTMPEVLSGYSALKIVDVIPDELSYIADSAKLSIGGGTAELITMTEDTDGNLYYIMDGDEFADSAGKFIELTLVFEVDGWVSGEIENTAELYFKPIDKDDYPDEPDVKDDETIYPPLVVDDLEKVAEPGVFRKNGDEITYTISFTMPEDLTVYVAAKIVDVLPEKGLKYQNSASLKIGDGAAVAVVMSVDADGNPYYELTGDAFIEAAGKTVALTLEFVVDGWVSGSIKNKAELYFKPADGDYPDEPDDDDEETIVPIPTDLLKTTTTTQYQTSTVGQSVTYTITFTLPDELGAFESFRIVDKIPAGLSYASVSSLKIGAGAVDNNPAVVSSGPSELSLTIPAAPLNGGDKVELTLKFNISGSAAEVITNIAELYYTLIGKGEEFANDSKVSINPYTPSIPPTVKPIDVVINARKTVSGTGARLAAGQFKFGIFEGGVEVANTTNDGSGNIAFTIKYSSEGTHTYIIKELMQNANGWYADTTEYTVTVAVTLTGYTLSYEIKYPDDVFPRFNNRYEGGGGGGGNPIDIIDDSPPLAMFIPDHVAYIIGYEKNDVRPENNITRAEVATVFFRLLTDDLRIANWTQENSFKDVKLEHWFNNAVSVMNAMGIVTGYPDGTFRPDSPITRGELAAISARFARATWMMPTNDRSFNDIAGHWAENDILYAAAIGWVNGYADGSYKPNQPITRAEFMTLVNRMLERVPETVSDILASQTIRWIDNTDSSKWYYLAVQEATNSHTPEYKEGKMVPDLAFEYERWVEMIKNRDWVQFERTWSTAYSG